jgi:hypothetical protein
VIEKLIVEHGSAVVQKQANEFLTTRNAYLEAQVKLKDLEIAKLKQQVEGQDAEIAELRHYLDEARQQLKRNADMPPDFDETTHNIIRALFDSEMSFRMLAQKLRLSVGMVEHHMNLLVASGFARQTTCGFGNDSGNYGLIPRGRTYAVKVLKVGSSPSDINDRPEYFNPANVPNII